MIRFSLKLFIFLSPIVLLLGLIEHKLGAIHTGYETKRLHLERSIADVKVIITGSSHSYDAIRPDLLGVRTFSLAYPAQDLYYDTRIMLKYLPRASQTELVVLGVSYFSFEYRMENSTEPWRTCYYYRFWNIPTASHKVKMGDYSLIALYGVESTRQFLWSGFPFMSDDHIGEDGGNTNQFEPNVAAIMDTRVTLPLNADNLTANTKYVEELLDALKAKRIRAVFVTAPAFHTYYENINPEVYGRMLHQVEVLCRRYDLKYYNYLQDSRFTLVDFYDNQHLSARGAEKFSKMLKDEVVGKYLTR